MKLTQNRTPKKKVLDTDSETSATRGIERAAKVNEFETFDGIGRSGGTCLRMPSSYRKKERFLGQNHPRRKRTQ